MDSDMSLLFRQTVRRGCVRQEKGPNTSCILRIVRRLAGIIHRCFPGQGIRRLRIGTAIEEELDDSVITPWHLNFASEHEGGHAIRTPCIQRSSTFGSESRNNILVGSAQDRVVKKSIVIVPFQLIPV